MDAYDLLVIGAGVNGAGIARAAAGRGLKVLVIDKGEMRQAYCRGQKSFD